MNGAGIYTCLPRRGRCPKGERGAVSKKGCAKTEVNK